MTMSESEALKRRREANQTTISIKTLVIEGLALLLVAVFMLFY
jgi:hypothetical protein